MQFRAPGLLRKESQMSFTVRSRSCSEPVFENAAMFQKDLAVFAFYS